MKEFIKYVLSCIADTPCIRVVATTSNYDRKSLRDTGNREAKSNRCTRGAFETRSLLPLRKINNNARVAGSCPWDDTKVVLAEMFEFVTNVGCTFPIARFSLAFQLAT